MKLSIIKKSLSFFSAALLSAAVFTGLLSGNAHAIQIPYEDIGSTSIETPVFNTYTNVPNGVGNEADFVRIRPSTGDVADNGQGGVRNALYVNGQAAACNVGDKFDIRTYIHNGADDDFNDNGNGTAVARDTEVRMVAPFNTPGKTFTFTSTVRATDVSPVTDTARLYCESDEEVMLKLVPQSVKVYSSQYGFQGVSDSAVNGVLPIGSRVAGSGDVWGCWADRVMVAYIVEVIEMPEEEPELVPGVCNLLSVTVLTKRQVRIDDVKFTVNDATASTITLDFGDGNTKTINANKSELPYTHTYAKDGTYNIRATVNMTFDGEAKAVTADLCTAKVTVTTDKPPVQPPKSIPNTGAGGAVAGIMSAVAGLGALAHRKFTLKRQ